MTTGFSRAWVGRAAVAAGVMMGLGAAGAARPAAAQDVHVVVKVDVSKDIERELSRLATETLPAIRDDISGALRDMADNLDGLGSGEPRARRPGRQGRAEQKDSTSQPLPIGPTGTLDITTSSGDITVVAGTGAPTLEVIKRARGRTDSEARQALDRVTITVDSHAGRVRVEPTSRGRADVEVSLVVKAPAGIAVNARSSSGAVAITGIRGDVLVHTANGEITLTNVPNVTEAHSLSGAITVGDTATEHSLQVESIAGRLTLSRVKARMVSAVTITGSITAEDVDAGQAVLKTMNGPVSFRGVLARNGHYEIHTQNGNVQFMPLGSAGFELDAGSFSGQIRIDPSLHLHTSRTDRHGLTGTVGDGAATVTIVTFNGAVVIGKS